MASLTAQARLQIADRESREAAVRDRRPAAAGHCYPIRTRATCSSTSRATRCGPRRRELGSGVHVGRAGCRGRVPAAVGARPRRRAPGTRRLPQDGPQAPQALPRNAHLPLRAYEKTALLRLAGRFGEGEDEVDDLLRSGVLVDLYPLVRKSIRVGAENYSLKSLEPLYMGSELRTGDVTTAAESITQYARYCELRADGRDEDAAVVLKETEEYNRYDCRSTRKLRDWLIGGRSNARRRPSGPGPSPTAAPSKTPTSWRARWRRSPATVSTAAPPSRPRSRLSPRHADTTAARTSRSGGRISTGSTTRSTNGATPATSSSPRKPRSSGLAPAVVTRKRSCSGG